MRVANMANHNTEQIQTNGILVQFFMFYNTYFPTDKKSYAVRLPVASMVISLTVLRMILNSRSTEKYISVWAAFILLAGVNYGLYYGIVIGDRKQFTPWILIKFMELPAISMHLVYCWDSYSIHYILFGSTVSVLNSMLLTMVCCKMRKKSGYESECNIYEFPPVIEDV